MHSGWSPTMTGYLRIVQSPNETLFSSSETFTTVGTKHGPGGTCNGEDLSSKGEHGKPPEQSLEDALESLTGARFGISSVCTMALLAQTELESQIAWGQK